MLQKPTINILTHLLDDDEDFLILLDKMLVGNIDIEYKIHSTAKSLLEAINEDKAICVIDYDLKDAINGLELMAKILKLNPLSYVIMMSSQQSIEIVTEFYNNDGFRYIDKSAANFSKRLIDSINKAKAKVQMYLDFNFELIRTFNNTQETIKDARLTLNFGSTQS